MEGKVNSPTPVPANNAIPNRRSLKLLIVTPGVRARDLKYGTVIFIIQQRI